MSPNLKDFQDAIDHADIYGDQGWTLEDFDVEYLGDINLKDLHRYDDLYSWLEFEESDFQGMSVEERLEALKDFRGEYWTNIAKEWLTNGIPPIVIISAPVISENELYTQVGDGRGRVNFAHAIGINKLPAYHLKYKQQSKEDDVTISDKNIALSKLAADVSDLMKINLSKLRKEVPKEEGEDPRSYYDRMYDEAHYGPVFSNAVISQVADYPDQMVPERYAKPFVKYIANRVAAGDVVPGGGRGMVPAEMVKDYINATGDINLERSWADTFDAAYAWHEQFGEGDENISISGDEVVYQFEDGFTIVKVSPENLDAEGQAMGHCVGSYCEQVEGGDVTIYSLRDPQGRPHVTVEVRGNNVEQIKGKQNEPPVEKYRKYIKKWLSELAGVEYKMSEDYVDLLSQDELLQEIEKHDDGDDEDFIAYEYSKKIKDPEAQSILLEKGSQYILEGLAANKSLDPELQKKLLYLSRQPGSEILAGSHIRAALASNRSVKQEEIHKELATDPSRNVRFSLAASTPHSAVQWMLVEDKDLGVVSRLLSNVNLKYDVGQKAQQIILSKNENEEQAVFDHDPIHDHYYTNDNSNIFHLNDHFSPEYKAALYKNIANELDKHGLFNQADKVDSLYKQSEGTAFINTREVALSLRHIIEHFLSRVSPEQRNNFLYKIRQKIQQINPASIYTKKNNPGASIGSSINVVKNVLIGQPPAVVEQVLNDLVGML